MDKFSFVQDLIYCVENYLTEELSISDDVQRYVDDILNQFIKANRNDMFLGYEEKTIGINNGNSTNICAYRKKYFRLKSKIYMNIEIPCNITVLDFDNEYDMNLFADKTSEWNQNGFSQDSLEISFTIKSAIKGFDLKQFKNLLCHEAEHAYQYYRKLSNLYTNGSIYDKAKNIIIKKDVIHTGYKYDLIANLLYYYNPREIDANINGLYGELTTHKNTSLYGTNFYNEDEWYKDAFNDFLELQKEEDFSRELAYFKTTTEAFIKYIFRQQKYMESKFRKVMMKSTINTKYDIYEVRKKHKRIAEQLMIK